MNWLSTVTADSSLAEWDYLLARLIEEEAGHDGNRPGYAVLVTDRVALRLNVSSGKVRDRIRMLEKR